jgi:hypothetical protein
MWKLIVGATALSVATSSHAAALFARADPYSPAAIGLNVLGLAILTLAAAPAVGALVAATWMSTRRNGRPRASWR